MTLFITHPDMLAHDTGQGHPERSARLAAVLDAIKDADLSLDRREAMEAEVEALIRVHPESHVQRILAASPSSGVGAISAVTVSSLARSSPRRGVSISNEYGDIRRYAS